MLWSPAQCDALVAWTEQQLRLSPIVPATKSHPVVSKNGHMVVNDKKALAAAPMTPTDGCEAAADSIDGPSTDRKVRLTATTLTAVVGAPAVAALHNAFGGRMDELFVRRVQVHVVLWIVGSLALCMSNRVCINIFISYFFLRF
jgi:hypothetical protein